MFQIDKLLPRESLPSSAQVHPTAIIADSARIGDNVVIGPSAIIGPRVVLEQGVEVGAGAIVDGTTTIGRETRIYAYATVGVTPQDLKYQGEQTILKVGERNLIREYVNISIGTSGGHGETSIGDDNLFMTYTHIAHDCVIGSHCIFANSVQIAGHVEIGDHVVFGGMAGAHQFCKFGDYAMIGAASVVVQDVPPYCMVQGDRAEAVGLNVVGLRRAGIGRSDLTAIKSMFKAVFRQNLVLDDAKTWIEANVEPSPFRARFIAFLNASERGLCR